MTHHAGEELTIFLDIGKVHLNHLEVFQHHIASNIVPLSDDAGVKPFGGETLGLFEEIATENDRAGGAVPNLVVHGRGGARNHHGRGVLDLHFVQEYTTILSNLNLTSTTDKHLQGAAGTEIGLEHALQASGGRHVHH